MKQIFGIHITLNQYVSLCYVVESIIIIIDTLNYIFLNVARLSKFEKL